MARSSGKSRPRRSDAARNGADLEPEVERELEDSTRLLALLRYVMGTRWDLPADHLDAEQELVQLWRAPERTRNTLRRRVDDLETVCAVLRADNAALRKTMGHKGAPVQTASELLNRGRDALIAVGYSLEEVARIIRTFATAQGGEDAAVRQRRSRLTRPLKPREE